MKTLLLVMTLLVLAGAGWFFFAEQAEPARELTTPEVALPEAKEQDAPADLTTPAQGANAVAPAKTAREALEGHDPLAAQQAADVRITGRVVLLEEADVRSEVGSGSLHVTHSSGELDVPVQAGQFEFLLAAGTFFRVTDVSLDAMECAIERQFETVDAREGLELEIVVRQHFASILHVRDRISGQDLAGVELWRAEDWSHVNPMLPSLDSDAELELENQTSPVLLPVLDGKQTWWAGAKGYAFGVVDINHRSGGEPIVLLDHEAKLNVQLVNRPQDENVELRLKRGAFIGPYAEFEIRPDDPSEIQISALAPGTLRVTAARVSSSMKEGEYALDEVELVAGEVSELTLRLPDSKPPPLELATVTVSGTVEVPRAQVGASPYLRWSWSGEGVDPPADSFSTGLERTAPDGLLFSWETQEIVPGPWRVEVSPFGYSEELEIGFAGASGIRIIVPPLALIRLEVVDADTQEVLRDPSIALYRPGNETSDFYLGEAQSTGKPGILSATLAPGDLRLRADAAGYTKQELTLNTRAGEQLHRIELKRATTVTFVLMDGTTVVRRDITWWLSRRDFERLDGEGRLVSSSFDSSARMTTELSDPGTYRFTFANIDGYLPIEPIEALLERGNRLIEIQLQRE